MSFHILPGSTKLVTRDLAKVKSNRFKTAESSGQRKEKVIDFFFFLRGGGEGGGGGGGCDFTDKLTPQGHRKYHSRTSQVFGGELCSLP